MASSAYSERNKALIRRVLGAQWLSQSVTPETINLLLDEARKEGLRRLTADEEARMERLHAVAEGEPIHQVYRGTGEYFRNDLSNLLEDLREEERSAAPFKPGDEKFPDICDDCHQVECICPDPPRCPPPPPPPPPYGGGYRKSRDARLSPSDWAFILVGLTLAAVFAVVAANGGSR